jgi:hypothetical protein
MYLFLQVLFERGPNIVQQKQINSEVVKEREVSLRTLIPDQRREAQRKSTKRKDSVQEMHITE